jgi:hypothetical protein
MAAKLVRLTYKIAIQLHLLAESCTICSSRSRQPVRKLLVTPSYIASKVMEKVSESSCGLFSGILLWKTKILPRYPAFGPKIEFGICQMRAANHKIAPLYRPV